MTTATCELAGYRIPVSANWAMLREPWLLGGSSPITTERHHRDSSYTDDRALMKHRYAYENELVQDLLASLRQAAVSPLPLNAAWSEVVFATRVVDVVALCGAFEQEHVQTLVGLSDSDLLALAAVSTLEPITVERLSGLLGLPNTRSTGVPVQVSRLLDRGLVSRSPNALRSTIRSTLEMCEVVAIEAKLHKHRQVLRQAEQNLSIADTSFVAVPINYAFKEEFLQDCGERGVGVLVVDPSASMVVRQPRRTRAVRRGIVRNHFALRLLQERVTQAGRWTSREGLV